MALSTVSSGGTSGQATTQSPQAAVAPATGAGSAKAAPAGSVQPGTTSTLLTSQAGVKLDGGSLGAVQFGNAPGGGQTSAQQPAKLAPQHHVNPGLLGISALLLVIAVVVFWLMNRSAKNTTK